MQDKVFYFSDIKFQSNANLAIQKLEAVDVKDINPSFQLKIKDNITVFLRNLLSEAKVYDEACQFFIHTNGFYLTQLFEKERLDDDWFFSLTISLYEVGYEYHLSLPRQAVKNSNLVDFLDVNSRELPDNILASLNRSRERLPFQIVKNALASDEIRHLKNFEDYKAQIDKWEAKLEAQRVEAVRLEGVFEGYAQTGNFVLLAAGFSKLLDEKKKQLKRIQNWVMFFGFFVITPIILEIIFVVIFHTIKDTISLQTVIASAVPTASLTIIAIYFFRIVLRNADSIRSQILQLELRRTVCEFVQKYAEFAQTSKESKELLSKFESLIFSNIVPTDEKIPSTFDGLEQVSNFIKNLK